MPEQTKLTGLWIKNLPAPNKTTEYYDHLVSGLILRVTKTGYKSFALRYRFETSKQITIGKFGDWTLAEARAKAKDLKKLVDDGIDPVAERQQTRHKPVGMTFQELSDIYDGIHLPTMRGSMQQYHQWAMQARVLPVLGKQGVQDITKQDIVRLLDKMASTKATANKVRSRLHHMFEFAKSRGYVEENPVSDTNPFTEGNSQRERFYNSDEIISLWQAFEELNEPVRSYMKIVLLTGQRRTETHLMEWKHIRHEKDVDFEGWIWVIPAKLAKSAREHVVPLSPLAFGIIERLKKHAGDNPFVFASSMKNDIPIGLKTIRRAANTVKDVAVSDFRLHDMRRTVATWLAKLGTPAEVVSKVLNHKTGGGGSLVTRIYNRYEYRAERQTALNKWAAELDRILTGKDATIHKIGS